MVQAILSPACRITSACFGLLAAIAASAEVSARQNTPHALDRAIAIERFIPGAGADAQHFERLADLSSDSKRSLESALQFNPSLTSARVALGLAQESAGELAESERTLTKAALFDHRYLPAWTLANFYFRRNRRNDFWIWAARAARLTYDDFRPLLRLCDAIETDPVVVLNRLGATAALERAYLDLLIAAQSLDRAEAVGQRLLARRTPEDQRRLAEFVSREIRADRVQPALTFWNALFKPLDADHGPVLTNGDLRHQPTGIGFDWTLYSGPGTEATWSEDTIRIEFTGGQPDALKLLEQPIPVQRTKRYRLTFEYLLPHVSTTAATPFWEMDDRPLIQLDGSDAWQSVGAPYSASRAGLVRLRLVYRRVLGTTPLQGWVSIRNIRVEVL